MIEMALEMLFFGVATGAILRLLPLLLLVLQLLLNTHPLHFME
jgi:hypothetical protein